ncbi:PrgU-like protein [Enterococcus faecalis 02-MB-P-10]|uniref:PrgU family protein n=1 Tax=Enterococcus faecalis TaxID=1351 RepID=UPI000353DBDF|nr:PrgU family protein [Enterococcus faecalis]EPH77098.1 PrgU-like protein [Enterococcus faecalis 02-MB-P-10]
MEQVKNQLKRGRGMQEVAIHEKDLNLRWSNLHGRLECVKVKKAKTLELWLNKQVTKDTIHEIKTLHILKSGKVVSLKVIPEKSKYAVPSIYGQYEAPMFYIATPINREAYHDYFLSEKKLRNKQKNKKGSTMKRGEL